MSLTLTSAPSVKTVRSCAISLTASIAFVALVVLLQRSDLASRGHVLSKYAVIP